MILRHILTQKSVTANTLLGGISVYFLLGNLWAFFYTLIERLSPHSFSSAHSIDLFYLSFVALTSAGYGDVIAVTAVARSAVILESVTGVLFVAVLVGRLVGMHISQRGELMEPADSSRLRSIGRKPSFMRKGGRSFPNQISRRRACSEGSIPRTKAPEDQAPDQIEAGRAKKKPGEAESLHD